MKPVYVAILSGLAGHSCIYFDTIDDIKTRYRESHQQERLYGDPEEGEFYFVFEQVENILEDHIIDDIKAQYQNMPHNLSGLNSTGSNHYYNITTLTLPEDVKISRQGGNFQYMDPSKREVLYMWPKICALKISS